MELAQLQNICTPYISVSPLLSGTYNWKLWLVAQLRFLPFHVKLSKEKKWQSLIEASFANQSKIIRRMKTYMAKHLKEMSMYKYIREGGLHPLLFWSTASWRHWQLWKLKIVDCTQVVKKSSTWVTALSFGVVKGTKTLNIIH